MDIHQTKELLRRYQEGNCTPQENEVIEAWYKQLIKTGEWQWNEGEKDVMQQILETKIMKQVNATEVNDKHIKSKPAVSLLRPTHWWAAASVIVLFGTAGYFLFFNKKTEPTAIVKVKYQDIKAPQISKAVISLANGQKVYLDSLSNGALSIGPVKLVKLPNGEIAYQQTPGEANGQIKYNTLSNPRGSKVINMLLADGSKVWLNAGSSLTYPVSFYTKERKVAVTGEAYFEVFHDASRPFIVSNGSMNIRVLGTHFNVNAFEDKDKDIKVTLLQGLVEINNGKTSDLLKPGEQASVNEEIKVESDVDLDKVMAWKNGFFGFDNATLHEVLKEISRWYDVEVTYEGTNQSRAFTGEIQRDLSLSEVLKILERNKVHFKIEGKKLIVMPD
jgi:transmembrane sensor